MPVKPSFFDGATKVKSLFAAMLGRSQKSELVCPALVRSKRAPLAGCTLGLTLRREGRMAKATLPRGEEDLSHVLEVRVSMEEFPDKRHTLFEDWHRRPTVTVDEIEFEPIVATLVAYDSQWALIVRQDVNTSEQHSSEPCFGGVCTIVPSRLIGPAFEDRVDEESSGHLLEMEAQADAGALVAV